MKPSSLLLASSLISASVTALALDTTEILRKARTYAVPETSIPDVFRDPVIAANAYPLPDLVPRMDHGEATPRGACERNSNNLCYDVASRQVVYRPIRRYMPAVDGLTPENISVKRGSIVFKYSFK